MDEQDKRPDSMRDSALAALYRGLPREEPPAALDAAILAAARSSVAAHHSRRWGVPVSLAAVLVLSVAVTLRISEERPDFESVSLPPPPPVPSVKSPAATPPSPAATPSGGSAPDGRIASRPGSAQRNQVVGVEPARPPESRPRLSPQSPPLVQAPPEPPSASPLPSTRRTLPAPSAFPDSAQAPPSPARAQVPDVAAEQASGPAERSASRTQSDRREMGVARSSAQEAPQEAPRSDAQALSPEGWLERIAVLRRQARHKEADESYAEFRRHYPQFRVSEEMLQRIAPPR